MSKENDVAIEKILYEETEKRLDEMSRPDYVFPKTITKADVAVMAVGFGLSLILIILCMVGGIK